MLKVWTISLALASFILTILGTFMTRSGIFNSVHSFTQSDIGPAFLVFLAILIVACFGLLASRAHLLVPEQGIDAPVSRETTILLNNLLLVAITFTVLLGTVFPLVSEAVRGVRVSVGEPYFNRMAVPGFIAVLFLMGVGPALPWGRPDRATVRSQLLIPGVAGLAAAALCWAFGLRGFYPLLTFAVAGFALVVTVRELLLPARARMAEKGEAPWVALFRSATRARRRFGGYVVHLGVILVGVAVAASSAYATRTSATIGPGQPAKVGRYELALKGFNEGAEPHRTFVAARVDVKYPNGDVQEIHPRINYYERSTDPIGTPALLSSAREDLYVNMLAFSKEERTASFNLFVFPLVSWIWLGIPVIFLGCVIAAWPTRKRGRAALAASSAGPSASRETERGAA